MRRELRRRELRRPALARLVVRGRREEGQILLLTLGFITFVGVIAVALAGFATTNLKVTPGIREARSAQFTADAAVDGAINAVRRAPLATQDGCFTADLNGQAIRVDCVKTAATEMTFYACPPRSPLHARRPPPSWSPRPASPAPSRRS